MMSEIQRRGDVRKCPVCGSEVDQDAYHCRTCHNYFCFHCRVRLLESDNHLYCIDPNCEYYGKLVCDVCDVRLEKEDPPALYVESEDGYWPLLLFAVLVLGTVTWYYTSFLTAAGISIGIFALAGFLLHRAGVNVFGRKREVTQSRVSHYHTCVRCKKPVKEVAGAV